MNYLATHADRKRGRRRSVEERFNHYYLNEMTNNKRVK